jgi:hypothetical protein
LLKGAYIEPERATAGIGDWGKLRPYLYLFNRAPAHPTPTTTQVGAVFIFFNAAGSSPAAHFLVYLCAKPTLRSARHDSTTAKTVFFIPGLLRHPLPADGGGATYSYDFFVDTPHSRRYLAHLRHATKLDRAGASATSTWGLSEGDRCSGRWYELLVNSRRWELVLNHCAQGHVSAIAAASRSLHGLHLSRNLRTFLARLIVPAWSSAVRRLIFVPRLIFSALAVLHEGMGYSCGVIHCLPWSSRSHYGWIPHNASFGFLNIASANVGVFASLDRF